MTGYVASAALESQGTIISIDATPIGEIVSFKGPGGTAPIIDVSNLQSVMREKRMGLPDEGQVTLEANMLPADSGHVALRTKRASRASGAFIIEFNDKVSTHGTQMTFTAYVLEYSVSGGVGAKITAAITLEITGAVTWVAKA